MSIINEALKKVQADIDKNNFNPSTINTMTTQPPNNSESNNFPENLPQPQPQPQYDPTISEPKAPWDIPAIPPAAVGNTQEQAAPPKQETIIKAASSKTAPASENKTARQRSFVIVFILIGATILIIGKNGKLLAEHNIHLRLPEAIKNVLSFPKAIFSHKAQALATIPDAKPAANAKDTLVVNAVMLKNNKHIALINDKIYAVGDTINGMKIVKIDFQEMVVQDDGVEKTIAVNLR